MECQNKTLKALSNAEWWVGGCAGAVTINAIIHFMVPDICIKSR